MNLAFNRHELFTIQRIEKKVAHEAINFHYSLF